MFGSGQSWVEQARSFLSVWILRSDRLLKAVIYRIETPGLPWNMPALDRRTVAFQQPTQETKLDSWALHVNQEEKLTDCQPSPCLPRTKPQTPNKCTCAGIMNALAFLLSVHCSADKVSEPWSSLRSPSRAPGMPCDGVGGGTIGG